MYCFKMFVCKLSVCVTGKGTTSDFAESALQRKHLFVTMHVTVPAIVVWLARPSQVSAWDSLASQTTAVVTCYPHCLCKPTAVAVLLDKR